MDNHADNFVSNLNYVAGLIDSDGSVYCTKRLVRGNKLRICPKITFTNTNFSMIELLSSFLHNNGINHYVGNRDRKTIYKPEKYIEISRLSKCMELANLLNGYCVGRKEQLNLIEKFCRSRIVFVEDYGWRFSTTPYTDEQISIADDLINLNYNYNYDSGSRNYTYSWMGGFIDGNGSIFISSHKQGNGRKDTILEPAISFSGESTTTFRNIKDMFDRDSILYTETKVKCKAKRKDKNKSKFYYNLSVRNKNSLLILTSKLRNKIFAKNKQLELLDEYLLERRNNRFYNNRCFEIAREIKLLNK
jgi:hypothetical protein